MTGVDLPSRRTRWREHSGQPAFAEQGAVHQALDSARVRQGLTHILLGPAGLYEALRHRGGGAGRPAAG